MRTLGPRTHLMLAIAAAAGLIASLRLPWYGAAGAPAVVADAGDFVARVEAGAGALQRAVSARDGVPGWDAFAREDLVLCGLAGAVIVLLMLSLVPVLSHVACGLARLATLGAVGLVAWRLVDAPSAVAAMEPRIGLPVALGTALMLLVSVAGTASSRRPAREPVRVYVAPPAPAYDTSASYGPPQY